MNEKEIILEAMKKAGEPLNAGKVAELTGLDRKAVDKAFAEMKRTAASYPRSAASGSLRRNKPVNETGMPRCGDVPVLRRRSEFQWA